MVDFTMRNDHCNSGKSCGQASMKKAQKKETKKKTSETIKRIIPQRNPSSTMDGN